MIKYDLNLKKNNINCSIKGLESFHYRYHKSLKNYNETPLYNLECLANGLGVESVLVKDESARFELNAFKILGASWAIANYLAALLSIDVSEITYQNLINNLSEVNNITFVTATDGNHGRGVARAAKWFSQKAVIYMPKGASAERVEAIKNEGAIVEVLDLNYDDAVRYANNKAKENNWVLIQDTAFNNYTQIPKFIINGYKTITNEIVKQTTKKPTHLILQAGVGSFAAAVIEEFINLYNYKPIIIIVEPHNAACYYKSSFNKQATRVTGDLKTIMAGLSCGEVNPIAYDTITKTADAYFSVDDQITQAGMRRLANPYKNDPKIISGESGAVGIGLLEELCTNNIHSDVRDKLMINKDSIILCISTEGATDLESYNRIVK